ncbi:MAG: 4Fe-4S binding protein [Pseudomonadota bacterium]
MPRVLIDTKLCKGCERCVVACPQRILGMAREINVMGYFPALMNDPSRCIGCGLCAITCPDCAIQVGLNGNQYKLFEY